MSQISSVCFREDGSDYADSERSHQCNSSSSIVSSATSTEKDTYPSISLETTWTDSKHSSYLDMMEANFVKNLYGRSYCVEDVCGQKPHLNRHREIPYAEVEVCDAEADSAQSQFCMPSETLEFKMYDHGDWTSRPLSRSMVPAGIPWVLLKNPWIKRFRTKNSSTDSLNPELSTSSSSTNDAVGSLPKKSPTSAENLETKFTAFQRGNDDSAVGQSKECLSLLNPVGIVKSEKQALWYTYHQVPVSRQKTSNRRQAMK